MNSPRHASERPQLGSSNLEEGVKVVENLMLLLLHVNPGRQAVLSRNSLTDGNYFLSFKEQQEHLEDRICCLIVSCLHLPQTHRLWQLL